ncbi:GFA family protein [uncultured Pelagimonas sp.]|uniref:GFA family protein n=1 Tax=uncultured Pelagimonas sp. TaxID=1618102 RepID=UPI002607DB2A|nr:GFA family protein [uncultured Pelagimonas sp.]
MIETTCHCGAVRIKFNDTPEFAVSCNCSVCHRLGTHWIYSDRPNITIQGATKAYAYGDKNLAFHSCVTCGCTTHWANLKEPESGRMAVNLKLADREIGAQIPLRHFDGADTWRFVD